MEEFEKKKEEKSDLTINDFMKKHLVYDENGEEDNMMVLLGISDDIFKQMMRDGVDLLMKSKDLSPEKKASLTKADKKKSSEFSWLALVNEVAKKHNLKYNSTEIGFCLGVLYKELQHFMDEAEKRMVLARILEDMTKGKGKFDFGSIDLSDKDDDSDEDADLNFHDDDDKDE